MRILIIGGSGLISTAITRKLLERGDDVVLFNRGQADTTGLERAARIVGDRYDPPAFTAAIHASGTFDCVIDMICYERKDARSLIEAVDKRTPHLIFCSTVDVYAKPASSYPVTESEPRKPVNAYGRGKAECEDVLMSAANPDLRVTVIRPAHTYGPGGRHRGNFVHAFGSSTTLLDRLCRGKPVIVPGDGTALRGSCHLEDISTAFANATNCPPHPFRACHVTSQEWLTWDRYHEILADGLGAPNPALVHIPTDVLARIAPKRAIRCPENYQFNGIYDNSLSTRELGYRYTIPFAQGSRETLAWVARTGGFENSDNDPFYEEVIAHWQEAARNLEHDLPGRER